MIYLFWEKGKRFGEILDVIFFIFGVDMWINWYCFRLKNNKFCSWCLFCEMLYDFISCEYIYLISEFVNLYNVV